MSRAELEAAIDDDPYDPRGYAVLADYLQELGDPRGELIALQLAHASKRTLGGELRQFVDRHRESLFGNLPPGAIHWAYGFFRRVVVGSPGAYGRAVEPARVADLLEHPSARFVAELQLDHHADLQLAIDVLAASARPALRALAIGPRDPSAGDRARLEPVGSLARLWSAMPRLRELFVSGHGFTLGDLDLPELGDLRIETLRLSLPNLQAVAGARWPALERCAIWIGVEHHPTSLILPEIRRFLDGDPPRLQELELLGTAFTDELVEVLARAPVVRRLHKLSLRRGALSDAGAELIARHGDAFAHLELDVSRNRLTPEGARAVASLGRVHVHDQETDDRDDGLYDY